MELIFPLFSLSQSPELGAVAEPAEPAGRRESTMNGYACELHSDLRPQGTPFPPKTGAGVGRA